MTRIYHRTLGPVADASGTVVLLHGFCESNDIWGVFANLIAQKFHVIIPDLPGFGRSALPQQLSIDSVGSIMWEWLDQLKVKNPVLIGHSLGGYVALAMADQRPNDVAGFSLFHSTAKPDTEDKKKNRDKVIAFVNKNGVEAFIETFVPGLFFRKDSLAIAPVYAIANSTPKDTLVAYAAAMRDRPGRRKLLEDFTKPVLIIAGEKDEIIPLDTLMDQAVSLQKGRLSILSDTGHMGMLESTNRCVEIVTQFAIACR